MLTTSIQREHTFRDKQQLKMKTETVDLEELDEGPAMSDFSFAHFVGQLTAIPIAPHYAVYVRDDPITENAPRNLNDFTLITWLVILDADHERYETGYGV